jgi:uncharacterized protein with PIN domain
MRMSSKREDLKAKLLAQAEAAMDRRLSDERLSEAMTLRDSEAVIGVSEKDFRQGTLEEIITIQPEKPTTCPLCGGKLRNKGKHKKRVVTLGGETDVERTYYHCEGCGKGYFPPR